MRENRDNKKSGNPTRPGHRSTASKIIKKKRSKNILRRFTRFYKSLNWKGRTLLVLLAVLVLAVLFLTARAITGAIETSGAERQDKPIEYIFRDGEGHPVDVEAMTTAWATEAGHEKRYALTDAERWEIASVITAEAVGEPYAGKVAVAQCILQACEDDGLRPFEAIQKYKYTGSRPEPCEEALEAVQDVFDFGHVATAEPIKYYYAPELLYSEWHESQNYVMTINGHRFFSEVSQ